MTKSEKQQVPTVKKDVGRYVELVDVGLIHSQNIHMGPTENDDFGPRIGPSNKGQATNTSNTNTMQD